MGALTQRLDVVCHQLRSPANLGAVARAMANFGASRLVLSDPATHAFLEAEKLAIGAEHIVQGLEVARDLREATTRDVYALGTTSRTQLKGRRALTPEEGIRRLAEESARGPVALVLGGEKRGLSDEDLSVCQDVVAIPTTEEQPSLNIAQAAGVLLYLAFREQGAPAPDPEPGARLQTAQALELRLKELLLRAEFLNAQAPDHALRELWRSLLRAKLTQREAEMWLSALNHLLRKTSGGPS